MTADTAKAADDGIGPKVFAQGPHSPRPIGQVDAVQPVPFHEKHMVFNDKRHIAGMRHEAAGIGGTANFIGVFAGKRQAQAGDLDPVHHAGQRLGEAGKVHHGRGDEGDLRAVLIGHVGSLRLLHRPP